MLAGSGGGGESKGGREGEKDEQRTVPRRHLGS